ncbi:arginyltransferase 1 isoform X1 [Lycorma delicatula]|uniref:arginyltransferase 1 isoform X1 n=1 Tax=Lycorma delicatula TaxID=130591 RepID=UPI003F51533A
MAASTRSYSIVEYYGENGGYRCGYCKSSSTNYSHGMWAHSLSVQDYQYLIDRGWRRSGHYIYKPTMHLTCCPMYTIRCSALNFKTTKSQKKIIKRIHRFLASDLRKSDKSDNTSQSSDTENEPAFENISDIPDLKEKAERAAAGASSAEVKSIDPSFEKLMNTDAVVAVEESRKIHSEINSESASDSFGDKSIIPADSFGECSSNSEPSAIFKRTSKPAVGADPSRPACKKAKILRLERKKQKLQNKGLNEEEVAKKLCEKTVPSEKSLEDFINEPLPTNPAHQLEIRLVNSDPNDREFQDTYDAAYEVYQKYQMAIHGDPPSKCSKRQYTRFLVNSPLQTVLVASGSPEMMRTLPMSWALFVNYQMKIHKETRDECDVETFLDFLVKTPLKLEKNGPPSGYGSFHQQYWLDSKLIAVGVIDILPNCVSSVYFYYDPDYSDLSLGTYASLRETSFTRSQHYYAPSIKYYYMGFYIDSCPKMRYKARLKPSFLLCPETYTWHPFEEAQLKLKISKYSRLNDDEDATDVDSDVNVNEVLVLYNNVIMNYRMYRNRQLFIDNSDSIKKYASLVGMKCARRLLLVQS